MILLEWIRSQVLHPGWERQCWNIFSKKCWRYWGGNINPNGWGKEAFAHWLITTCSFGWKKAKKKRWTTENEWQSGNYSFEIETPNDKIIS